MKLTSFLVLPMLVALGSVSISSAKAQDPKIGVVDMQECLNKYYKTEQEVAKINALAKEKQSALDARRADYEALTRKAAELDKTAADTSLGAEPRQQAMEELRGVMQERMAKGREIAEAEQKARQEVLVARQAMEKALVDELREVVEAKAAEAGLDLIFDKSFLPKANKVILVANDKVPDITTAIIEHLNVNAPASATPSPGAPAPAVGNQ
jgi:Skp family chaperone for outer membrane proteins